MARRPLRSKRTPKTGLDRTKKADDKPKRKVRSRSSKKAAYDKSKATTRGAAGFERGRDLRKKQQEEYEKNKLTPYRFRLRPGDEGKVVILDEEPFFVREHLVKHNGKWTEEVCIADTPENCPICDMEGRPGSYVMMLTCIDLRSYTIQKGPNAGKTMKISRKLFPVKGRNQDKFERQFIKHKENMRGLKVTCRRSGDKEAAIGEDLEFDGKMSERDIQKRLDYLKKTKVIEADDKVGLPPYEDIFTAKSEKELRAKFAMGGGGAGSEEFDNGDDDDDLDNVDWD